MTEDDIVAIEAQLIAMPLANRGHEERELIMNKVPALTAALRAAWDENERLQTSRNSYFRESMLEAVDIRLSAIAGIYPENTERRVRHHLNMLRQEIVDLP